MEDGRWHGGRKWLRFAPARAELWRGVGFCGAMWRAAGEEMLMRAGGGLGVREYGNRRPARWVRFARADDGNVWRALASFGARSQVLARVRVVEAHSESSLLLAVVRIWDHVLRIARGKVGFSPRKSGKKFLFFGFGEVRARIIR
jgi:hypothetical protein